MAQKNINDTRERILVVAEELFLKNGYRNITMSKLEKATGLTKGAFYHHFKDKSEIFSTVVFEKYTNILFTPDAEWLQQTTLYEFLEKYVSHFEVIAREKKYFKDERAVIDFQFFNFISDILEHIPGVEEQILNSLVKSINMWEGVIFRAKENREIREDINVSVLAQQFLSIPSSSQRNLLMGKSLLYILSTIRLQFEQLYLLIKK